MYTPPAFREDDLKQLHTLMNDYSFATLVTQQDGVPLASHLPFLLDTGRGQYGMLLSHMAHANTQWQTFDGMHEALVIFQGPHTYVSPSWYKDNVAVNVPTWNYAVAHAYGKPRLITEQADLYALLQALVQKHEGVFENPWTFDYSEELMRSKMKGFVGFAMEITRLEGKGKLSQNRSTDDQRQVITALEEHKDTLGVGATEVAKLMRKHLMN
ncbi:MAG: FMN-binding negative transcriptional regulator [Ktedonobacteraceae bacterium]